MQQFWKNSRLMLLCFCSLQVACALPLRPAEQQYGMCVSVSLLQDAFFSQSSSVTVSCLLETPFILTSPAPSCHSLPSSQLTFLPLLWFCLSYPWCVLILLKLVCLGFFFNNTFKIYFQKVWYVKFCPIICKAARGMRHQLFARTFVSVRYLDKSSQSHKKQRLLGNSPARAHPTIASRGVVQAWRLWLNPAKSLDHRWYHSNVTALRSS